MLLFEDSCMPSHWWNLTSFKIRCYLLVCFSSSTLNYKIGFSWRHFIWTPLKNGDSNNGEFGI